MQALDHNAPIADVRVVWARLDGVVRGFIVERGGWTEHASKFPKVLVAGLADR